MGNARWDDSSWQSYRSVSSTRSVEQNFSQRELHENLNPRNIEIRESCDSAANPFSTPIILGLDVTGSMGFIAQSLATTYLGKLIENILERKPVTDPHMMVMGIGDVAGHGMGRHDRAPLQVSQFEADIRIAEQLAQIYVERGGCGNGSESYHLPWHFAANFTKTDCWDKHNRKGYIFTIGDEGVPPDLTPEQLRYVYGKEMPGVSTRDVLRAAQEKYNVYHLVVAEGDYCRHGGLERALNPWRNLLGENAIVLEDHTQLADIVCEIMLRNEQADPRILTEIDRVVDLS